MKPKKVWVLFGGESAEREVSVKSGTAIAQGLIAAGFDVRAIEFKSRAELPAIFATEKPDIVYIGLHGTFGEDGTIQGYLETIGVPYVGSRVLASAVCMNKLTTQKILRHHRAPIAHFIELNRETFDIDDAAKLIAPDKKWFIKAASQGSTLGIFRYDPTGTADGDRKRILRELCEKAFTFEADVLVEEWIEGRELSVPVVNGDAYPIIEIRPNSKYYDYQSKYTAGQTEYLCPAPIDAALTEK